MPAGNCLGGQLAKKTKPYTRKPACAQTHTSHSRKTHSVGKIVLLISGISHRSKGSIKKWCCCAQASFASQHMLSADKAASDWTRPRDSTIWCSPYRERNNKQKRALTKFIKTKYTAGNLRRRLKQSLKFEWSLLLELPS